MTTTQNQTNMDEKIRQLALESFSLGLKEEFEIYLSGFKAGFEANKKIAEAQKIANQVEINGVLWDTENLEIDGKTHFTYDEALKASASVGKRLPTEKEYKSLLALGWEWSETNKGIWIAKDKLFLPAAGYRHDSSGAGYNRGSSGYYWSGEVDGARSSNLYFNASSTGVGPNGRAYGFAVRCVQDVKKNNSGRLGKA